MIGRPLTQTLAALVAIVFGVATVISGGRALFGGVDMGAVVPFVLWFNFTAGFAYILAGFGLWRRTGWAHLLSLGIALATIGVFTAFLLHIWQGGLYQPRTIGAMILRTLVWALIAAIAIKSRPPS